MASVYERVSGSLSKKDRAKVEEWDYRI
jgi:CRP-like cAMP-binding protein